MEELKVITFDGKEYKMESLSEEAKKVIEEARKMQTTKIELGKDLLRAEGIEQYLNAKLKELLPKE